MATPRRPRHDRVNPNRLESQASPDQSPISFQIPIGFPSLRSIMPDLASVLHAARSHFCCTPARTDCCATASTSRRLVGFYSAYDTTTASAAARGALSSGGVPHSTRLCCLVTGAPASPLTLPHSQCMRIPLLIFAGAAALFVSSSRPPPRRHRPARRAVMAAIDEGSDNWWL